MALNPRQEAFAEHFAATGNATKAAILAGYAERSAHDTGSRLLKDTEVFSRIKEIRVERTERTGVSADRVVEELGHLAHANILDVAEWTPDGVTFKSSEDLPREIAAAIKSVKSVTTRHRDGTSDTVLELVLHDKQKALDSLGRKFGIFTDKIEHAQQADGFTIRLKGLDDKPRG